MGIAQDFARFGQKVRSGFQRFGQKAKRDFQSVGTFVKDKALPAIEKVAGQVGRGIVKYGVPIASVLAPGLAPVLGTIGKIAGRVGSAAGSGRRLIKAGEGVASAVQGGDVNKIIGAGLAAKGELKRAGVRGIK